MDSIRDLGTDIPTTFAPTYAAYSTLLNHRAAHRAIHSTTKTEYSYGPHPRQKLDLYTPSSTSSSAPQTAAPRPILIFMYGGAFVSGDKVLPNIDHEVAYTNVGHFFSEKLGFNTIVMDYRLVGQHDAKFPSGGEDVDLVMKWVNEHFKGKGDVFVLANSAGAVHLTTWLFAEQFAVARNRSVNGGVADGVCKLQGVALLGAPYRLDPEGGMKPMLEGYLGEAENIRQNEPTRLMEKALTKMTADAVSRLPRTLVVVSELDPEEHIVKPAQEYFALWKQLGGRGQYHEIAGHNHLSPPLSLATGVPREEVWGYEVGNWFLA